MIKKSGDLRNNNKDGIFFILAPFTHIKKTY